MALVGFHLKVLFVLCLVMARRFSRLIIFLWSLPNDSVFVILISFLCDISFVSLNSFVQRSATDKIDRYLKMYICDRSRWLVDGGKAGNGHVSVLIFRYCWMYMFRMECWVRNDGFVDDCFDIYRTTKVSSDSNYPNRWRYDGTHCDKLWFA